MRADEEADRQHAALTAFQSAYGALCTAMAVALYYGKDRTRVKMAGGTRTRHAAQDKWLRAIQDRRAMANLALDAAKATNCSGPELVRVARASRTAVETEWECVLPMCVGA